LTTPDFSLDAARVSKVNDPGDLRGLVSIKPGSKVWLMLYFTVNSLPRKMQYTTTYEVLFKRTTVFKVAYQSTAKMHELGRFSHYVAFTASRSLTLGAYLFRATLKFGSDLRTRHWKFSVGRHERMATKH
jgi:hypothetical protein